MFITTKILSVDEAEAERAEDLGMPIEPEWIDFSFKVSTLRLFYEWIDEGEVKGTIIMLDDYSEYTTNTLYSELVDKVKQTSSSWIYSVGDN